MLKGKVAIVTGSGYGIGRGIALSFSQNGASVTVADKIPERAESVGNEIKSKGGEVLAMKSDVTVPEEVAELMDATVAKFGRIDILVNNAGQGANIPTLEMSYEQWNSIIGGNLGGTFLCSQAAAPYMMKQNYGVIINIASVAAHGGVPGMAAYCAAKAGVQGLTRVLAVEWAPYNITVNAINPGMTRTGEAERMQREVPKLLEKREERVPLGRIAEVSDIANMALFLANPQSHYITGQEFTVDGGMFAIHPGYVK